MHASLWNNLTSWGGGYKGLVGGFGIKKVGNHAFRVTHTSTKNDILDHGGGGDYGDVFMLTRIGEPWYSI